MRTLVTISTIAFFAHSLYNIAFEPMQYCISTERRFCKTERDSLTNKIVYIAVDKEAVNEGGLVALMRQYRNINVDSIPDVEETKFIVAFIVESDGQITGERIIKDKTYTVGQQMIKIAKSFKWIPAECKGQKVPMLVKLPLQICLEEE